MEEFTKHKRLRVLMTADSVGGVWSYAMQLCKALLACEVQFFLVSTGGALQTSQKEEVDRLPNVTLYETLFLLEWMSDPWEDIDASGAWLLQLEAQLQPDLIHINGFAYGALAWKAPALVVAHSDVWSWWLSVKKEDPPAEWNEYFRRVQEGLQQAAVIVAPSMTMMKYIRKIYSVSTAGKVIYNGISEGTFYQAAKAPVIFSMGRIWDEAKNIRLLVDAAPHIACQVRIAGHSNFDGKSVMAAGTNISFLGKLGRQEIAAELSSASVYVHPAKYEPFGLAVLEAALSGCALVLGDIDSLHEIWTDNAIYVDTDDANALAETVNYLMDNESFRLQYAARAIQHATKYSGPEMNLHYRALYDHLLHEDIYKKELT